MALYVNTNVSSLNGRNKLGNATNALNTTYQRLSSGLRINSAKDDAAGLQISDRLTTQINGLNQGNRNASDGVALLQTMEGAMDEMTNMLQRVRTLAVQSANGTNTKADREAMNAEVNQLSLEITRIACKTTFGGQQILAGNGGKTNKAGKGLIISQGITLQVGANTGDTIKVTGLSAAFTISGIATRAGLAKLDDKIGFKDKDTMSVSAASVAAKLIDSVDKMIGAVDKQRGTLGAMQNRLESTIRNQSNIVMNTADARARIRDADFAEESANLTQQNIIQQAASSMLMQSNMRPQMALSLIG